jgi:hypothetical protein
MEGFDGRLKDDSPAIDAGSPELAPVVDVAGRARDDAPDIGAYEWRAFRHLPLVLRLGAP